MSEYMVDVNVNANVDGYVQSMGQAVAITKQYTSVADGLNGRLADLNGGIVSLTQRVTGFNKVNTVALDQAAAYQKVLSGVEAKATLSGKSFDALAKTTKTWAREFPIGLGRAVEVMTSLQQSGIRTEKQMGELGKSFIKLGAATGSNAAAIGTEFLQLSRTMGNGIAQFEKLSDSLVSTTAKIGGSAPAVVAFSKALAPVAATVGLSQTAVIGLSSSMSRLGEDGYQAANSLNKVLLDMNRSIRDGGPELKAYADLMGMTGKQLRDLFKANPAEVVSRFAEAVAKQGPNISRTLDALGFDSVRTTRSLTALARSGGPREAIATAVAGYGDGSTSRAAEVAMEGVADQAEKLQESMSQVVANVGQPMLGVAKMQLQLANQVSGLAAKATESEAGQQVLGAGGVLSLGGGIASNLMLVGGALALRRMAFGPTSAFGTGRAFRLSGQDLPAGAGPMANMGYGMSGLFSGAGRSTDLAARGGMAGMFGRAANGLMSFALQAGVKANDSLNTNYVARTMGMPVYTTPVGQQAMSSLKATPGAMLDIARGRDFDTAMATLRKAASDQAALVRSMAGAGVGSGVVGLGRSVVSAIGTNAAIVGADGLRAVGRGVGALGSFASRAGITPAAAGVMGAVAVGTYAADQYGKGQEALDRVSSGSQDIYGSFNTFAEGAGMAGRGLVSFQEQVQRTTESLVDNNDTMDKAFQLSSAEVTQATSSSYKPSFEVIGDDRSVGTLTAQAVATLGSNARPQEISRLVMDVANQTNAATAQQVASGIKQAYVDGAANIDYNALIGSLTSNKNDSTKLLLGTNFANDAQGQIGSLISTSIQRKAFEAERVYGGKVSIGGQDVGANQVVALQEAKKAYEAFLAQPSMLDDESQVATFNAALAESLGFNESQAIGSGLGSDTLSVTLGRTAVQQGKSFEEFMRGAYGMEQAPQQAVNFNTLRRSGFDFDRPDMSRFGSQAPANEMEARQLQESFAAVTGASSRLTDSLYGADKAAREFATLPSDLSGGQLAGLSREARAQLAYEQNPTTGSRLRAGEALSDQAFRGTRNPVEAMLALALESAKAPEGYKKDVAEQALSFGERNADLYYSGARSTQRLMDTIQTGYQAQRLAAQPSSVGSYSTQIQSQITLGMQAQGQANDMIANMIKSYGAMQAQIRSIGRSSGIASGAVARDARLSEQYAAEDYQLQRTYGRQDYRSMRRRAQRDFDTQRDQQTAGFNRQQQYAQQDYERSVRYATDSFNRQMGYQQADFDRSQLRAQEDFLTSKERALRDFGVSASRSQRDFNVSQARAQVDFDVQQTRAFADFNRGRLRMAEDFDRQMRRMTEDSAKAMYDPYKRIAAQMTMDAGQLVANLSDQADALKQQVGNLAEARSLGLSEQAIKQLNLADSQNAQQLGRIVGDLRENGSLASELNAAVSSRFDAGSALSQDAGNTQMQRAREDYATGLRRYEEDFATSMERSSKDFELSKARASQDFTTSMTDARADFTKSMSDMQADFDRAMARAGQDFGTMVARSNEQFGVEMSQMLEQHVTQMSRSSGEFALSMQQALVAFNTQMNDALADYLKGLDRGETGYDISLERMRTRAANAISDIGAQAGAQIKSMEEQFVGLLQTAPKDPAEAARRAKEILKSLGIDKDLWGQEMVAIWDLAVARLTRRMQGYSPDRLDRTTLDRRDAGSRFDYSDAKETGPVDAPSPMQMLTSAKNPTQEIEAWKAIGRAVVDGFKQGFTDRIDEAGGFFTAPIQGIIDAVKAVLGMKSPSRVFYDIGANVVQGLKDGFEDKVKDAWRTLTEPIDSLRIDEKVSAAFTAAKSKLGSIDVGSWVDWSSLTSGLPSGQDVTDRVSKAFAGARTWLAGLAAEGPDSVKQWMSGLRDAFLKQLPTLDQVLSVVKKPFTDPGGVFEWLGGLAGDLRSKMPTKDQFLQAFVPLRNAMKETFSDIIGLWNKLDVSPTIRFERQQVGGFQFDGWNVGGHQVIPAAYFPGVTIPAFSMSFPDLVPSIPNPFVYMADGGIATRQTSAVIAEAGYPEAVIPLNARGAEVLAATMARYVDDSSARHAMVSPYATSVVNNYSSNEYDYSTQFNGQITVQADDPDRMARQLQARVRRQALAQPIRGRT